MKNNEETSNLIVKSDEETLILFTQEDPILPINNPSNTTVKKGGKSNKVNQKKIYQSKKNPTRGKNKNIANLRKSLAPSPTYTELDQIFTPSKEKKRQSL